MMRAAVGRFVGVGIGVFWCCCYCCCCCCLLVMMVIETAVLGSVVLVIVMVVDLMVVWSLQSRFAAWVVHYAYNN